MRCAAVLALIGLLACERVLGIDTGRYLVDAGPKACSGTIRVRVVYDMTGPTRDVGNANGKGIHDRLRDIGSAGGIRGCALDIDVQDSKYDTQATVAVYDAWRARHDWPEVSAIFVQGTPMTQVLGSRAGGEQKVVISTAYAGELAAPVSTSHDVSVPSLSESFAPATVPVTKKSPGYPFVFFQATDYTTSARIAMRHAWQRGAGRVGFFYCSTSAFCTDPVDGAKAFLERLGGTQVGRDLSLELADTDAQVEAKVIAFFQRELDHKTASPGYQIVDWIWFGNTRASLASLGRALTRASTQLGLGPLAVITNTYALDEDLYAACGDACVGFYGAQAFPVWGDPSAEGMQELVRVHAKYRAIDGEDAAAHRTVEYVSGYVAAETWKIAAEAVADAGLPVTGANVRDALERFREKPVLGFAALTYSSTDHRPQGTARIYQLSSAGVLRGVGQPLTIQLAPEWIGW